MKTNKEALVDDRFYLNNKSHTRWFEKDMVLNVNFAECMVRAFSSLFVPWIVLAINPQLMGEVAAPIMFYLFISGLVHFCPIRYVWQHWIKHIATPAKCQFAIDLNIPIKAV